MSITQEIELLRVRLQLSTAVIVAARDLTAKMLHGEDCAAYHEDEDDMPPDDAADCDCGLAPLVRALDALDAIRTPAPGGES